MVTKRERRWSSQRPAGPVSVDTRIAEAAAGRASTSESKPQQRTYAHSRSQSWIAALLRPAASVKRKSSDTERARTLLHRRQAENAICAAASSSADAAASSSASASTSISSRPRTTSTARKPVPVITRVDNVDHPPRQATLSWPVTSKLLDVADKHLLRSSSMPIHLSLKPLPIAVEEEKARLAAWDWDGVAEEPRSVGSPPPSTTEMVDPSLVPPVPAKERRLSAITASESSTSRRTSSVSDASADIAFSGPILHNPPPVLPALAQYGPVATTDSAAEPAISPHPRRSRALSPIFEAESSTSACHSAAVSAIVDLAESTAALQAVPTARPILHLDATLVAARKISAYSASVYSTSEQELLHSYFSPETPPIHEPDLGGLAISGVDSYAVSPSAPASPQRAAAPGSAPDLTRLPVAYALALANKPSFSRYRFPTASPSPSPPLSEAGKAASLLDSNEYGLIAPEEGGSGAPSSALTAATSTFESPLLLPEATSTDLKALSSGSTSTSSLSHGGVSSCAPNPLGLYTHGCGSGLWRSGWTLESPMPSTRGPSTPVIGDAEEPAATMPRRTLSTNASLRSPSPDATVATDNVARAEAPSLLASTRNSPSSGSQSESSPARQARPVSFAVPEKEATVAAVGAEEEEEEEEEEGPASPSQVFDLGTRTLSIQRKKSKVLPAIPDSDAWSGTTDRIEVYCQRELVRHGRDGRTERVVLERTLLFGEGEGASRDAVGVAV
ncbi:hypothetical protein JCM3774_006333 [Rhodotorula dairenensis]